MGGGPRLGPSLVCSQLLLLLLVLGGHQLQLGLALDGYDGS